MSWTPRKFEELVDFHDHDRVPLSTLVREKRQGKYRYFGAQGVIDYIDDFIFDGEFVLIAEDGANLVTRNQPIAQIANGQFWVNNHAHVVKAKPGVTTNYFINTLINSMNLTGYVTGAAQPKLSQKNLRIVDVSVPSLHVQKQISKILSAYDDLIETNRRRIELLEQSARLLYKEWFVHLRFPGHEHVTITNGIPDGWKLSTLGECATFFSGGTPRKSNPNYWGGHIPWVSSGELKHMRIHRTSLNVTEEGVSSGTRLVEPGAILAVVRGMSLAKEFRVGIAAVPVSFNQDLRALVSNEGIDSLFLFHSIYDQRDSIRERASDSSHGTKKLDTPVLSAIPILVPPRTTQALFCDVVTRIHAQWDTLDCAIQKLEAARDLLLPRLTNGEIAV